MFVVSEKHHGINLIDCWYAQEPLQMDGIIRYKESKVALSDAAEEFETLITDLTQDEEVLMSLCDKNCRYAIRKSPKDGTTCRMKIGQEISDEDLQEFFTFFDEFWKSKGVVYTEGSKQLAEARKYRDAGAFAMTTAQIQGKVLVYHTYIVGDDFARSFQSASMFRTDLELNSHAISYANRLLHFEDMKYFKQLGKRVYDWGGAGTREEVASITEFKRSFGGTPVIYYNSEETRGAAAKLYKGASSVVGKIVK